MALLVTACTLGYVFLLAARELEDLEGLDRSAVRTSPAGSTEQAAATESAFCTSAEFWTGCVRLGIGNLLVTGPLFLCVIGGTAVLAWIDPPLLLLGLPLLALQLMRLTANSGLRRATRKAG